MKKIAVVSLFAVLSVSLLGQPASSQTNPFELGENSPVQRIRTVGEDGGLFFVVYCKSGKEGSVAKYDDPPNVCAGPPEECKPVWDIVLAAESMCRK